MFPTEDFLISAITTKCSRCLFNTSHRQSGLLRAKSFQVQKCDAHKLWLKLPAMGLQVFPLETRAAHFCPATTTIATRPFYCLEIGRSLHALIVAWTLDLYQELSHGHPDCTLPPYHNFTYIQQHILTGKINIDEWQ